MLLRKATIFFHPLTKYTPTAQEEDFFNYCREADLALGHIVHVQDERDFAEFHEQIKIIYDNEDAVTILIDDAVHIYDRKK